MDLTFANVRSIRRWTEGSTNGRNRRCAKVEIHGIAVGGTTNKIPASAFGFSKVEEATPAYDRQNAVAVVATPDHEGDYLLFWPLPDGTGPDDVTAAATPNGLYLSVKGY